MANPWDEFQRPAAAPQASPWDEFQRAPSKQPADPDPKAQAEIDVRSGANQPDYRPQSTWFQRFSDQVMDPFGVQDEMVGAGQAVRSFVTSDKSLIDPERWAEVGKAYEDAAERIRAERRVARDENGFLPDLVGGFATSAPSRLVQAAAPFLTRFGNAVRAGAGYGAVAGFTQSEGGVPQRAWGATKGALAGGSAGPVLSEVVIPAAIRTGVAARQAMRYGNQALRRAQNPEQAAIENVADRMVQSGIDPTAMRARVLADAQGQPLLSANLQGRGITEENLADIISRSLRGDAADQIGQAHGITGDTVRRYVARYQENNPTPMNPIDYAKEMAGEGGSGPVTRLGRAAYSLAGDESGEAAGRLTNRQDTQSGRVSNVIQRSVAGGDYEATRAAGLEQLRQEADAAYRQFYGEPELAVGQLGDLMADPLFRRANIMAQRQARIEAIRRNQDAARAGQRLEPVPAVDPDNEVFPPETLDLIQRQLRIASEGAVSNPTVARHAQNLREVFLDRIEDHYQSFRGIRQSYARGMGEFGGEGALEAGYNLTARLGAPAREALRGFDGYTPAQQELFRLGFARSLMDKAANPQIGGAVANQFNNPAVREIVERLYPRSDRQLWDQGQRLLRDLRREVITTKTKNDVLAGARTAELGSDMSRMREGAEAAADVATGNWRKLLDNLSTRLSTQIGRRGAQEVIDILTRTDPAQLLPTLNRMARAAASTQQRQAYVAALRQARSIGVRSLAGIVGQTAGTLMANTNER